MELQYTREAVTFPGAQALTGTANARFIRDNRSVQFFVDPPEELPTPFQIQRGPELLINIGGMQSPGPCLFKHALVIPKASLQLHCTTQSVCATGRVRFGVFDVSVCVVKPAFPEK